MSIFYKCGKFRIARRAQAVGLYPYFVPIEETTATEARIDGRWRIMLGSNNYLGLTHHPKVIEAAACALKRFGSGATGSRFLNGTFSLHEELEARLAALSGKEAAVVFTTGYQANLGTIAALIGHEDHVFIDELDHASIVDGAKLSHGHVHRYAHGDADALDRELSSAPANAGKLVVTDSVFSMEGSIPDLPALLSVTKKHNVPMMLDEAHAIGVFGDTGAGVAAHLGVSDQVDLIMGTFSKSLASVGGFIAGSDTVIHWLRNHSRSLMFTASMPPASVAGVLAALDVMAEEPERRARLWENTRQMADGIRSLGFEVPETATPIIPVIIGEGVPTAMAWRALLDDGVFTHPIVPPAVAADACRIRVSMSAEHTPEQIERALGAFERMSKLGLRGESILMPTGGA